MITSRPSAIVPVRVRAYLVSSGAGQGAETPVRSGFVLLCHRLDAEAYAQRLAANPPVVDIVAGLVVGWDGIDMQPGQPAPFTVEGLRLLLSIPNLAAIALRAYEQAITAEEVAA